MKKIIAILFLALGLSASASAQVKLGVKGGLNVSSLKLNDNMWATDNKAGFFFGPMLNFGDRSNIIHSYSLTLVNKEHTTKCCMYNFFYLIFT